MRIVSLFSGGKDSTYAIYIAEQMGWTVSCVASVFSSNPYSFMFHTSNIWLTQVQAKSMRKDIIIQKTEGIKEEEIGDLKGLIQCAMKKHAVNGVVCGAIASEYQKHRVDMTAEELGLKSFAPLWHKNPKTLLKEMIDSGFVIVMTSVSAEGFDLSWLGRIIDMPALKEIEKLNKKHGTHVLFEGGEAETLVLDCPLFEKKINIMKSQKVWDNSTNSGVLEIKKIELKDKGW